MVGTMEGFGGLFGDPEELQKRMAQAFEQMQAQQGLVWADNAIKLAVEMTVAAINRVNIQGTVEQQAEQIRSVMATVFPDAVALVREARSGLQYVSGASCGALGRLLALALLAAQPDRLLERADPEDRHERDEPHRERRDRDDDLLADRVGGDRRPGRAPANTLTSSACCTPAPPGVNGTTAATALTPSTSSTLRTDPPTLNASSRSQNAAKRKHQPANCQAKTSRK